MAPLSFLNVHRGKGYLNVSPFPTTPQWLSKRCQQELTLYHYMAQQLLTHPRPDQSFCLRALSSYTKAVTAATAKWILGIKPEFSRPAPVTVDTFHIHLKKKSYPLEFTLAELWGIQLQTNKWVTFAFILKSQNKRISSVPDSHLKWHM